MLAGEIEITASDGEPRQFPPGSILLAGDTTGEGYTTVVGNDAVRLAAVETADRISTRDIDGYDVIKIARHALSIQHGWDRSIPFLAGITLQITEDIQSPTIRSTIGFPRLNRPAGL